MAYHAFKDEDGNEFGSFEVFYISPGEAARREIRDGHVTEEQGTEPGWYWWACFPGCLPDGEPSGPFESEQEAIDDAQNS